MTIQRISSFGYIDFKRYYRVDEEINAVDASFDDFEDAAIYSSRNTLNKPHLDKDTWDQ